MNSIRSRRNASLRNLAGAAMVVPASATVITRTLDTPLTIGGPETIKTTTVTEVIILDSQTGVAESFRDNTVSFPIISGQLLLQTSTTISSSSKPIFVAAGVNTRLMTLADAAASTSAKPVLETLLPERLDAGRTIGAASNWGFYKPESLENETWQPLSLGVLLDAAGSPFVAQRASLWGTGTRGSIGFAMDALEVTGNFIDGTEEKPGATWADPLVPEYVQVPEYERSLAALYGWAEIGISSSGLTLYSYAYEDTGVSITTVAEGISAVPEPGNWLPLTSLLAGSLLLRSRRRAQVSPN
jgi:hypothetical protein